MGPRTPCSFVAIWILAFTSFVHSQESQATPPAGTSALKIEVDRRQLLARAQQGDKSAQMWLGTFYEQGQFGQIDSQEALKWFKKAAVQGDSDAQIELGRMYEDGEGVQQSYAVAAQWYRKAAEHVPDLGGAGQGRNNLGMLYLKGLGVPRDYVQAYVWFRLANSQTNLSDAKNHMTLAQILQAERMAQRWERPTCIPVKD
jgi:uncharacterized protein